MLFSIDLFLDTNITFNSVNPGLVRGTGHLGQYFIVGGSFFVRLITWPWMWLFLKSPIEGCQTIVFLTVEPTLHKVSGYFFRYVTNLSKLLYMLI